MRITSEEIARLANVSRSTVSRVINHYPNVPEETRKKVMAVIEEYGYEPNSFARALAGKRSRVIAFCICDEDEDMNRWQGSKSPYFLRLLAQLITETEKYGYTIVVQLVSGPGDYNKIENLFLNREICGAIMIGFEYHVDQVNQLIRKGHQLVVIDAEVDISGRNSSSLILSENVEAGYLATRYLIEQGKKKIGHIAGDRRKSGVDRTMGYKKALAEAGLPYSEMLVVSAGFDRDKARDAILKLYEAGVDAVFAANDQLASAAVWALARIGVRVPEDIAVVGCDYDPVMSYYNIDLSSVEMNTQEICEKAVQALIGGKKETMICKAVLHEGETV